MISKISSKLSSYYFKYYRVLFIIPFILLLFSAFFIYEAIQSDGTPIYRDISLKGGLSATLVVDSSMSAEEVRSTLQDNSRQYEYDVSRITESGEKIGYIIDTDMEEEEFREVASQIFNEEFQFGDNYSSNFISPSLSASFFQQALIALGVSFIFMSTVIFIAFREYVPSFAVILSAFFDVVVTIGMLDAFGITISVAGVGALLMLIGYSIDTDVLLTNRLVKEQGKDYKDKLARAFTTGLLMTSTTLAAGIGAIILTNSEVIQEIALILVIGLLVDFVSTWFQNAGILLWWLEKRKH